MPPTTSEHALVRGDLTLRPAVLDDANLAADLLTARLPDEPMDPRIKRHWWASGDPDWTVERFIVLKGRGAVGFAWHLHAPWEKMPERYARVSATFSPVHETPENLSAVFDMMEDRARRDGARVFTVFVREDLEEKIATLLARGYRKDRYARAWELDLVAGRARLLRMREASRARMREQGITIGTMRDDHDADRYRKLHEMSEEAAQDVPRTVPHVREPLDQFMKWFASPGIREERMWIARLRDDVVGVSALSYPPVRGNVWTDWTATARAVRGRGIARALKLETIGQAINLEIPTVRTDNDSENAPILHLNAELGYTSIPGRLQLVKDA